MSSPGRQLSPLGDSLADQSVDVQRYATALRRGAGLIAAIVIVVTVVVVALSTVLPKSYEASSTVVFNPSATLLGPSDSTSTQRELATFQAFVQSPAVLAAAARTLSESPTTLKKAVNSSADPNANIITITATARKPVLATRRANAVATAFLAAEQRMQTAGFQAAQDQLQSQLVQLQGTPGSAVQIAALKDRISALQISAAGTSSQLQIGEPATVPLSAASPKPAVDGLVALVASLLLSILYVLGRDQLRPRFTSPRELGRVLGLPVLAGVPYRRRLITSRRRHALDSIEREAYDTLQATVMVTDRADGDQRTMLITSASHSEAKTTTTASLGRSLARAGQKVLMISGDLRSPALHEQFRLPRSPGFAECLETAATDPDNVDVKLEDSIRAVPGDLGLDLLDSGGVHADPSSLLSGRALDITLDAIRRRGYNYVLIDSAPILGLGDTQYLATKADDVLLVARLDTISPDSAEDLRALFTRLRLNVVGVVVIGARIEFSPYYMNVPPTGGIAPLRRASRAPQRSSSSA